MNVWELLKPCEVIDFTVSCSNKSPLWRCKYLFLKRSNLGNETVVLFLLKEENQSITTMDLKLSPTFSAPLHPDSWQFTKNLKRFQFYLKDKCNLGYGFYGAITDYGLDIGDSFKVCTIFLKVANTFPVERCVTCSTLTFIPSVCMFQTYCIWLEHMRTASQTVHLPLILIFRFRMGYNCLLKLLQCNTRGNKKTWFYV